jgi:hypothetical protein
MKRLVLIVFLVVAMLLLSGCEEDSGGLLILRESIVGGNFSLDSVCPANAVCETSNLNSIVYYNFTEHSGDVVMRRDT